MRTNEGQTIDAQHGLRMVMPSDKPARERVEPMPSRLPENCVRSDESECLDLDIACVKARRFFRARFLLQSNVR